MGVVGNVLLISIGLIALCLLACLGAIAVLICFFGQMPFWAVSFFRERIVRHQVVRE